VGDSASGPWSPTGPRDVAPVTRTV
jgi:hypothetical protein